jgi:hypothetical protein
MKTNFIILLLITVFLINKSIAQITPTTTVAAPVTTQAPLPITTQQIITTTANIETTTRTRFRLINFFKNGLTRILEAKIEKIKNCPEFF